MVPTRTVTTSNSSFCAMLLVCSIVRGGKLPCREWSEEQGYALGFIKGYFILYTEAFEPSTSFEGFRVRLQGLRSILPERFWLESTNIRRRPCKHAHSVR